MHDLFQSLRNKYLTIKSFLFKNSCHEIKEFKMFLKSSRSCLNNKITLLIGCFDASCACVCDSLISFNGVSMVG